MSYREIVSIQAVHQRLELLLALDVRCEVTVTIPSGHANLGRGIRRIERKGGYLSLFGESFSVHINEDHIEAVCVAVREPAGGTSKILEFRGTDGRLCASIVCPLDGTAAAWRDVLDSFIYAHRGSSRIRSYTHVDDHPVGGVGRMRFVHSVRESAYGSVSDARSAPVC
ncbi:MAG: hypothetical protein U1E83_10190 [Methylotetracoccus sp.]